MPRAGFVAMLVVGLIAGLAITGNTAEATDIPQLINYQGKLTDSEGNPLTGQYDMAFEVFDAATGGTSYWSETRTGIQVTDGLFNVKLGSVNPIAELPDGPDCWLEITVEGQTISPRPQLVSVPYAYRVAAHDHTASDIIGGTAGYVLTATGEGNPAEWQQPVGRETGLVSRTEPLTINTNVETQLVSVTIPANELQEGSHIRITASGVANTGAQTNTVGNWRVKAGGTNVAVVTTLAWGANRNNVPWMAQFELTVRSPGASGSIIGNGFVWNEFHASNVIGTCLKGSATASPVTVNTTEDLVLELTFQLSQGHGTQIFSCHNAVIEYVKF